MRRASSGLFAPAALLLGLACSSSPGNSNLTMNTGPGGGNTGGTGTPTHATVSIVDYSFGPSSVTIARGGSVAWSNDGVSAHTVTADSGAFNSGQLAGSSLSAYGGTAGGTFSYTFTLPGTYTYHCANHPTMTGKITVQ